MNLTEFAPGGVADGGTATPIPGAEVCVIVPEGGPCATTDAMGVASVAVAKNTELAIRMSKSGFVSLIYQTKFGDTGGTTGLSLVADSLATAFAGLVGVPWPDMTNGVVSVGVSDGMASVAGAKASITGSAAGPFYLSDMGVPDMSLTATTTRGIAFFGTVPAGEQTVTITPPSGTCTSNGGWDTGTASQVKALVRANTHTVTGFICK